jgi:cytochrome c oxidase cbb3-type subunit 2
VAFREYKIGARMFGLAFGTSMFITLYMPAVDIASTKATPNAMSRQLSYGRIGGFSYEDPFLLGWHKPTTVDITKDPKTGADIEPTRAYVYAAGTPFPSGINHPRILGKHQEKISIDKGRINEAKVAQGAVFVVRQINQQGEMVPYIEDATAVHGWTPDATLAKASDSHRFDIGKGKIMFVREGCWWCHTLLPEETQDWQYFGAPPMQGDFNGESPTAFGSDRKAPDLTHVGSRNSSRQWMTMHFFNPRLVQPHSIMPRFDYLWGDKDASGKTIDYAAWRTAYTKYAKGESIYPPEVPVPAPDSEARALIDFILNLK